MISRLAAALPVLALSTLIPAWGNDRANGADLIQQAVAKLNIFALPSFEMKADITVESGGKLLDGSFGLLWNGPDQWREEIVLPGYSELEVAGTGVVFRKRTADFVPIRIAQLHAALGFGSSPRWIGSSGASFSALLPGAGETVKKVHERKVEGAKAQCVEVITEMKQTREVCIDESRGVPMRNGLVRDAEWEAIGSKVFPRSLTFIQDHKTLAEVKVTELKLTDHMPASKFEPPPGATSFPGCMNPSGGSKVRDAMPHYPDDERGNRIQGKVEVYQIVGPDGIPKILRPLGGPTNGLIAASIDALKQWRYDPATCNGTPVETETVTTITYSLSSY